MRSPAADLPRNPGHPIEDANAIGECLSQDYGFEVHSKNNLTYSQFRKELRELQTRKFGADDQLLVFVSGHGEFFETGKDGYLILTDTTKGENPGDPPEHGWPHSQLRDGMNAIPCKHILLLLDTCYSGAFDESLKSDPVYEGIRPDDLRERILRYKTRYFISSGGKEVVSDGVAHEHSPFARRILETLRTQGAQRGYLTTGDLTESVRTLRSDARHGAFVGAEPGCDFWLGFQPHKD